MKEELIVLEEVKYPVSTDDIQEFLEQWKNIPSLDPTSKDKTQYKEVKNAHIKAVKFRTSIEKKRKELKAPALEYGKKVDSIAKEFQEMINPKEIELFAERNKVDQYEKEQEQLRINAERERVENIDKAIVALKMIPLDSMGKTSQELTEIYESIEIPTEAVFAERLDEAMSVYKDTLLKLETAIDTATKAEQAEKMQAEADARRKEEETLKEADREKERKAFEAEKEEFERQKQEQERLMREQQEEINRQNAERESEELAKQQEQERLMREQQNKELMEECKKEAYYAIDKYLYINDGDIRIDILIDYIINGDVAHIRWVD